MKFLENVNFKKSAVFSGCALCFAVLNGYIFFPKILEFMLKRNLQLKQGSQMRVLFDRIPFPLEVKVYLFNLTNPNEVMNGGRPHLQEIGPYIFDEWKEKSNMVEDEKEDTIEFTLTNTFIFRLDKSNGLTGNEIITIPHLVLMSTMLVVKKDREPMLPLATKAMNVIFEPKTPFVTASAMDLMFNGIFINCDVHDFSAKAVCAAFESESSQMQIVNETTFKFSLLGSKNATDGGRFLVSRGVNNIHDLGRVLKYQNEPELDVWSGDACNKFIGTDSTIFPPFMKKEEGLWAFTPDICRSMGAHYIKKSKYSGFPTSYYGFDLGDLKNQPELHCFCNHPPDGCPLKGTMDLQPCVGAPLIGSKPHFLDADPQLLKMVDGLAPNKDIHDTYVHFELLSGTPLSAEKKLQFNLAIEPVEQLEVMAKLPKLTLPIFWISEGAHLNKTYTNILKYQLFLALNFNEVSKWLGIVLGSFGLCFSAFMIYRQNTIKATITSVSPSATIDRTESAATTIEKNGISIGLTNKNSKNNLMTISKRVQDTP